jgi:hypothetical protein
MAAVDTNRYIAPCFTESKLMAIGFIITITDRTNRILAMLEPTTLPITIAPSPLLLAIRLTTNSGRLVPNAITVNPITNGEILRLRATRVELSIRNVEP